jgi:DNA-binding CsgD family transcriptional regulator
MEEADVPVSDERPLTPREVEVMERLSNGETSREVARALGISPHTVNSLLERVFEKLDANDRAQAVAIALRRGLVD